MKTQTIAFALAAILLAGCSSFKSIYEADPASNAQVGMKWECFSFETDNTVVTASVDAMEWNHMSSGEKWKIGEVEANGIVKDAEYRQNGLDHKWLFDFDTEDGSNRSSFVIAPSNYGRFYDFTANYTINSEGMRETESSFTAKCKRTK